MKSRPEGDEKRRLAGIEHDKADRLAEGPRKESHLKRARDFEADAHSKDWRDSGLQAPK